MTLNMVDTDIPGDDTDTNIASRLERIEGDLVDIKAQLGNMVTLVAGIAEEAGPMINALQGSPIFKMLGGK